MAGDVAGPSDETASGRRSREVSDWADLGEEVWAFLTSRGAAVDYSFVDMTVEVPRDTGQDAPRATWKLNGTLRVTTSDRDTDSSASRR